MRLTHKLMNASFNQSFEKKLNTHQTPDDPVQFFMHTLSVQGDIHFRHLFPVQRLQIEHLHTLFTPFSWILNLKVFS